MSTANDKFNCKSPNEHKKTLIAGNNSKYLNNSPKVPNLCLVEKSSQASASIVSHPNTGGLVTNTHSRNNFKQSSDSTPISALSASGDTLKRKRGRPRILDSDSDVHGQFPDMDEEDQSGKILAYIMKP